jgi:hypothetical protein
MDTIIEVVVSSVYGIARYYPANKLAETLAKACDQTTLTAKQLKIFKEGGFTVVAKTEPVGDI